MGILTKNSSEKSNTSHMPGVPLPPLGRNILIERFSFFPLPSPQPPYQPAVAKEASEDRRIFRPLTVFKHTFLCARMSSKFNVKVTGCSGAVVLGDNAYLSIGSTATDGKCGKDASHRDLSA